MSISVPVLPFCLFSGLVRTRHCLHVSLHWYWQELLIAHYWKHQQTQILFEVSTWLPNCHSWWTFVFVSRSIVFLYQHLQYLSPFSEIFFYFFRNASPVCLQKSFYLPHQLTFPLPVGFCLPATALEDDMTWTRHLFPTSPTFPRSLLGLCIGMVVLPLSRQT